MTLAIGSRIDPPYAGGTLTAGTTGVTVTFPAALSDSSYAVCIQPVDRANGALGETWISRSTTGFVLYNDGASNIAFTWAIVRY